MVKNGQIGNGRTKVGLSDDKAADSSITRQDLSVATGKSLRTIDRELARQRNPEIKEPNPSKETEEGFSY